MLQRILRFQRLGKNYFAYSWDTNYFLINSLSEIEVNAFDYLTFCMFWYRGSNELLEMLQCGFVIHDFCFLFAIPFPENIKENFILQ